MVEALATRVVGCGITLNPVINDGLEAKGSCVAGKVTASRAVGVGARGDAQLLVHKY